MEFIFRLWLIVIMDPRLYVTYFFPIFSPLLVGTGFALYRHKVKYVVGGAVVSVIVAAIIALEVIRSGLGG